MSNDEHQEEQTDHTSDADYVPANDEPETERENSEEAEDVEEVARATKKPKVVKPSLRNEVANARNELAKEKEDGGQKQGKGEKDGNKNNQIIDKALAARGDSRATMSDKVQTTAKTFVCSLHDD